MPKMSMNNGGGIFIGFKASKNRPLWLTTDLSSGAYAYKSRNEIYRFTDGSETETQVTYSSAMYKFLFGINYEAIQPNGRVSGYFTLQAGYVIMNSKIFIEDPENPDDCVPLANKNIFKDGGSIYSLGIGMKIRLTKVKEDNPLSYIDIGIKYNGGDVFNYINIHHMKQEIHGIHNNSINTNPYSDDFAVKFVNVTTNEVHEHKIAEVYRSTFKMINIKIGYLILF